MSYLICKEIHQVKEANLVFRENIKKKQVIKIDQQGRWRVRSGGESFRFDGLTPGIPKVHEEASGGISLIVSDHEAYHTVQMPCIDFVFRDLWWIPAQERLKGGSYLYRFESKI